MATQDEIVDTIAGFAMFADLSTPQLQGVAHRFEEAFFPAGERVLRQGLTGSGYYIILNGEAAVVVDGVERARLQKGDFFGEISILQGGRRTATITCATRCEILELDRATLDRIALRHPGVLKVMREFHDQRAGSTVEHMIRGLESA